MHNTIMKMEKGELGSNVKRKEKFNQKHKKTFLAD